MCVGDRAEQVGAARSTIDWCVRPLALTSMSQQCVTLTLSGAELLCFVPGKEGFGGARRLRNSGNLKVSGLERI